LTVLDYQTPPQFQVIYQKKGEQEEKKMHPFMPPISLRTWKLIPFNYAAKLNLLHRK
jgi:hypothetical protein